MLYVQIALAVLVGLLAGGVANALSDDLPLRRKPRKPHCPHCDHPRHARQWLAVVAFVTGVRACSNCGEKLGWRHLWVEMLVGVGFGYVAWRYGINAQSGFVALYVWLAALITVIDLEHKLVLNVVMGPALALGLLEAAVTERLPFLTAVRGGAVGFGVVFGIYLLGALLSVAVSALRGKKIEEIPFGYGDVTLATFAGLVVGGGAQGVGLMLTITVLVGGLVALIYMLVKLVMRRYKMFTAIPYGPNIIVGMLVTLLWRAEVGVFLRSIFF